VRPILALLTAMLSLGLASSALADTVYLAPDDFLREAFGTVPAPEIFWLDKAAQEKLTHIFGHPYRAARVRYWRDGGKTAWILEEVGKEFPITAGFLVQDDHIDEARVLIYRETRGMEIHFPGFLRQFSGTKLADGQLSSNIDGISGATLSVWAMQRMARAALTLNQLTVKPRNGS
jgi:hypothetical protein